MAWNFDGINDSFTISDNAALTLPDGNFSIHILMRNRVASGWGTSHVLFGSGLNGGASGELDLRVENTSGDPETAGYYMADDAYASEIYVNGGGTPLQDTVWHAIDIERNGSTISIYIDGVLQDSASVGNVDAFNGDAWVFGKYWDASDKWWDGDMAEFCIFTRAIGSDRDLLWNPATEEGISANHPSVNTNLVVYVPMYAGDYTEKVVGITVTNSGTTGATHPDIYYPLIAPTPVNLFSIYSPTVSVNQTLEIGELFSLFSAYVPSVSHYPSGDPPFPEVADITDTTTTSGTSHTINLPTVVDPGDLLFMLVVGSASNISGGPAGWGTIRSSSQTPMYALAAVGNEDGGTTTITTSGAATVGARIYRIKKWRNSGVLANDIEFVSNTGSSAAPDPGSLNPTNWGTENTLWIAAVISATAGDITAYPANYSSNGRLQSGGVAELASATRELAAASEDPGAFTASQSVGWRCHTVAIRPSALASHTVTAPAPDNLFTAYLPIVELAAVLLPPSVQLFDYYSPNLVYDKILTVNETFQLFSFFSPVVNNDTISIPTTYQLFTAYTPQVVYEKVVSVGLFQLFSFYSPVVEIHFGPGTFNTETFVPQTINTDTDSFSSVVFNTSGFTRKDRNDA